MAGGLPASATVIVGDGYGTGARVDVSTSAYAQASEGRPVVWRSHSDYASSLTLPMQPLSMSVVASASDADGLRSATASGSAQAMASFNTAAAGTIRFTGMNSAANTVQLGSDDGYTIASANGGSAFTYAFWVDADAAIDLTYLLSSPTLGCCGNSISLLDTTLGQSVLQHTIYDADNIGTLSAVLAAGDRYLLQIAKGEYPFVDAPYVRGPGASSISYDDLFTFSIGGVSPPSLANPDPVPAVPEPGSWAMLTLGLAMLGGVLRRRTATLRFVSKGVRVADSSAMRQDWLRAPTLLRSLRDRAAA